ALADAERACATRRVVAGGAVAAALVAALPPPFASPAPGVGSLPERSLVRAGSDGFVEQIDVADGAPVRAGQVLFTLAAPLLAAQRARLEGRIGARQTTPPQK